MSRKKRYVVIADYPHNPYKIGDLLEEYTNTAYKLTVTYNGNSLDETQVNTYPADSVESYPALFHKLNWWELLKEDDLKDLPEYIMIDPLIEIEPPFVVFKIIKWELEEGKLVATNHKKEKMSHNSLRLYLPSNKIEFAKYIREWNQYIKKDEW